MLAEIQETVKQIDREIRTLAFLDYPAEVSDGGLGSALRSLARGLQSRTGMPIDVEIIGEMTGLNDLISLSLLRVAQEALTNVHRHAHATRASITFEKQADLLELIISDNGIGMRQALERTTTHRDWPYGHAASHGKYRGFVEDYEFIPRNPRLRIGSARGVTNGTEFDRIARRGAPLP